MFRITSICLTIFFLGLMSASITHAESYSFVTKWDSSDSGYGQLFSPNGVAVDSSGNVYVVDLVNYDIQKFNSNGKSLMQWGSDHVEFDDPDSIAVDSSGNVYVVDRARNLIIKYDSNGNYLTQWGSMGGDDGQFYAPQGIAVDSSGNVYVADQFNNRIQKFDSNGTFITKWGSTYSNWGSGDGQFLYPCGVAVDSSGNVYVSDRGNNRIQKFDSNGTFITKWGSWGSGDRQFTSPNGVAVDSLGNVYVVDTDNHRIQKFNSNGNYLTQWGSMGGGDGQFLYPYGVAVDSLGNVYVSDSGNNRIEKFAPTKPVLPVANFTSNVTSCSAPLTVKFTDLSENTTSWNWDFGDENNSTDENPVHTFSKAGNYTINLTASNANGTDSKSAIITVSKPVTLLPVANFTARPTSGKAPLTVSFTDQSTGSPTSWRWVFSDGANTTVKYSQNPIHRYSQAGNYTVKLTATNAAGSNTIIKTDYIKVTAATPKPVAAFSASPISGNAPLTVSFTDKSTGSPTSWRWVFEDGANTTVKYSQNPIHKYSQARNYTVKMTATNAAGSNTTIKTDYIKVTTV